MKRLCAIAICGLVATPALAIDKPVYSWTDTFAAGFAFFQQISEHPAQTPAISTAQYAMLVKNDDHDFRICRLHYTSDGKTPVGICEDVIWLDKLPKGLK